MISWISLEMWKYTPQIYDDYACTKLSEGRKADTLECVHLLPPSYHRLQKEGFALFFQETNAALAT